jgi:hypothetical protein
MPPEFLLELANTANDGWSGNHPWAIVVTTKPTHFEGLHGAESVREGNDAVGRRDNALAVYQEEDALGLRSLRTFVVVVSPKYPLGEAQAEHPGFSIEELAATILKVCLEAAGIGDRHAVTHDLTSHLTEALKFLANAHEGSSGDRRPWNSDWFHHVEHGMHALVDCLASPGSGTEDLPEVLRYAAFACFSVPTPDNRDAYSPRRPLSDPLPKDLKQPLRLAARAFGAAIEDHWSSEALVMRSVQALAEHPHWLQHPDWTEGAPHPMGSIDWSDFDETKEGQGCALLALACHKDGQPERWKAFAGLTESQFLNPSSAVQREDLELFLVGSTTPLKDDSLAGPLHVIDGTTLGSDTDGPFLRSPLVTIELDAGLPQDEVDDLDLGAIAFQIYPRNAATFIREGPPQVGDDGRLSVQGWFKRGISVGDFTYEPKLTRIQIQIPLGHPLVGRIDDSASCELVLLPPEGDGVLIAEHKANGGNGKIHPFGSKEFDDQGRPKAPPIPADHELKNGNAQRVVIWSSNHDDESAGPTINRRRARDFGGRPGLWAETITPSGKDTIEVGSTEVELVLVDSNLPFSPIVAAVQDRRHDTTTMPAPDEMSETVRGDLEDLFSGMVADESWTRSLGNIILPSDMNERIEDLVDINAGDFRTLAAVASSHEGNQVFKVQSEIVESDPANRFREAFRQLGIRESLLAPSTVSRDEDASAANWVSRTSWAHLAESDHLLDEYLTAYLELLQFASGNGGGTGLMWASYPFSASVWELTKGAPRLRAVLMGPLHPLRLTWLANAERLFRDAGNAPEFAGTVHGWDIPIVGPSQFSPMQMVAMPSEAGSQKVFMGWSALLHARTEDISPLEAPEFVGNRRFPGVSTSAVTAQAAKRALKDYLRINPHVSTLTVELAAAHTSIRDPGLDEAIIQQVVAENLPGGLRVFDSTRRMGDIPAEAIASATANQEGNVPLTWSCVDPSDAGDIYSDMRFVQDAAIGIGIYEDRDAVDSGVVGPVPVRRLSIPSLPPPGSAHVEITASLRLADSCFSKALSFFEGGTRSPSIRTGLDGGELEANTTSWTVSAESLITPVALTELLSRRPGPGPQMLWEWHPPFLDVPSAEGGADILEARPYVSIAKVGTRFKAKISSRLGRAMGRPPTSDEIDKVLSVLGQQGIGLSSLVLIGDKQQAGAIGFYTVLELMKSIRVEGVETLIMPLDASNHFLGALAGNPNLAKKKLADLLVIQIGPGAVTFAPIEIKCYGLDRESVPRLPTPGSGTLRPALQQLAASVSLLTAVEENWADLQGGTVDADAVLQANAMAVFLEAAMRLSPSGIANHQASAELLERVVEGRVEVRTGKPVLAYLCLTDDPDEIMAEALLADELGLGVGWHAEFLANPKAVMADLSNGEGPSIEAWKRLFEEDSRFSGHSPAGDEDAGSGEGDEDAGSGEGDEDAGSGEGDEDAGSGEGDEDAGSGEGDEVRDEGIRFPVGSLLESVRSAEASFWPSNTALNQLNIGLVGDLGTGKTQLLQALIAKLRRGAAESQSTPISVLVIDYKGDFQKPSFLEAVGGEVLDPRGIPLDVFGISAPDAVEERVQRSALFIDVLTKIYGGIGPVQQSNLEDAMDEAWDTIGLSPTFENVLELYLARSGGPDAASGIIRRFVRGRVFASDPANFTSFEDLLDDKVKVLALDKLGQDQRGKNALVAMFLNHYYDYMRTRTRWPYVGNDPQLRRLNSYLVVDEATNIMRYEFGVLGDLLLQGREFGVGVALSSQFLSHFREGRFDYKEPLKTWFIHKVPNISRQELNALGIPGANDAVARQIQLLGIHEAYYSSLGFEGRLIRGTPFFEYRENL